MSPQDPILTIENLSSASATFARPADTTTYAVADAVANSTTVPAVLTFANLTRNLGGTGVIQKARIMTDQAANTAKFRLHLFNTAPTPINDNSPYTLLYANKDKRIGSIDFVAMATEGTGSTAAASQNITVQLDFACATADQNLYGMLETLDIFTPASAQNFFIELLAEEHS